MYLSIKGDFDPNDLITQVSLTPWKCLKKHSKSLQNKIPRCSIVNYGKVEVTSECPDLYQMSDELFRQLEPYRDELIALSKAPGLHFCCSTCLWMVHSLEVSTPPIGFHSDIVSLLGSLGASIDVDTYRDDEYIPLG